MRKFIVKYFALNYIGKRYTQLRASVIIYPLMVINGLFCALDEFNWIAAIPLAISLYFGFIYFRFYPVKWEELDRSQKFQFGSWSGSVLTEEQEKEWQQIYNEMLKEFEE